MKKNQNNETLKQKIKAKIEKANSLLSEAILNVAEKESKTAVELNPDNYNAHADLAVILRKLGKIAEVNKEINLYRQLKENPRIVQPRTASDYTAKALELSEEGLILAQQGDVQQGIRKCREAVNLDPNNKKVKECFEEVLKIEQHYMFLEHE